MANTGKKFFNTLVEVDADTGIPTGNTKSNVFGDPDYVPPVVDYTNCITTTTTTIPPETIRMDLRNLGNQTLSFDDFRVWYQSYPGGFMNGPQTFNAGDYLPGTSVYASDDFITVSGKSDVFSNAQDINVKVYYKVNSGLRVLEANFNIAAGSYFAQSFIPVPRTNASSVDLIEIEITDI